MARQGTKVAPAGDGLRELAQRDPAVAALASIQAELLEVAQEPVWEQAVPDFERRRLDEGLPLLHGQTLKVDMDRLGRLLTRLAQSAARGGSAESESVQRAVAAGRIEPVALVEASIRQNMGALATLADGAQADLVALMTLAHLASWPLLQACGRRAQAAGALENLRWEAGYCPVCAAWPALAEVRGLEHKRWLRCGRCSAGWRYPTQRCAFCGNNDYKTLGYLAPEDDRETRRAVTCQQCQSYLKTFTTIGALSPEQIALHDLTSIELDVASIERDYARPDGAAFPLGLTLAPVERRSRWLRWG